MRGYLVIKKEFKKNFFDNCFNAYWKNNMDISNQLIVENILETSEIEKKEFFKNIQNPQVKDNLRELTQKAFNEDIFGAPTFVVNNKIFWGQDRLEYALDEYNS